MVSVKLNDMDLELVLVHENEFPGFVKGEIEFGDVIINSWTGRFEIGLDTLESAFGMDLKEYLADVCMVLDEIPYDEIEYYKSALLERFEENYECISVNFEQIEELSAVLNLNRHFEHAKKMWMLACEIKYYTSMRLNHEDTWE